MATHCFIPMLGKRIRATELDICGAVTAESMAVVTNGFITLSLSSEIEDGTEILVRNADGSLCVNEKMNDSFKRFTLEMEFCGVNPDLLSIVTNAETYEDYAGDAAGFTVSEGEMDKKFALELWTGMAGGACDATGGGTEASGYFLLPFLQSGVLGDITVDGENAITFSVTGAYTRGGNSWGAGNDLVVMDTASPAVLPTALDPYDHLLMIDTAVAPPASACEAAVATQPA